jgi:hypothetical protein
MKLPSLLFLLLLLFFNGAAAKPKPGRSICKIINAFTY